MNPRFVADDCVASKMFCDNTSGTTGTSINIWLTGETVSYGMRCSKLAVGGGMVYRDGIAGLY